jgi:hypothetical protein
MTKLTDTQLIVLRGGPTLGTLLAEHILETKAGDFEPKKFEDRYENAVVEMFRKT